jgi:hypothetical protein
MRTNYKQHFNMPKQEKFHINACPDTFNLWVTKWKSTFAINAQNVLHGIQCKPRHVSSWTAASVQRCRGSRIYSATAKHRSCIHKGFKCGVGRGGHAVGPPVPIRRSREHLAQHGAPSCMYHIRDLNASGTSSNSFGRSCKDIGCDLPVSRCGETKQSPTVPVHILIMNCCLCLEWIILCPLVLVVINGYAATTPTPLNG